MSGFDNGVLKVNRNEVGVKARFFYAANEAEEFDLFNSDGSPESVVAADKGSICSDTTNGTLYVKTTDTVNTGWEELQKGSLTIPITVPNGGTGLTSLTDGGIMIGSGTAAVTVLGQATNGQIPIGSTGADPVLATITAGTGMAITNGAGTISINSLSGGFAWNVITGTSQTLFTGNGYFANNAGTRIDFNLGGLSTGDAWKVVGNGAAGWRINVNGGTKIIRFGSAVTTVTTGYIESTNQYDCCELVCFDPNTVMVINSVGNLTVV